MAAEKEAAGVDPFEAFRQMRDTYLEGMSKVMIDAVNTEEYAQASGALLSNYLTLSAPFREAMDKAIDQLSANGTIASIYGRYGVTLLPPKP